MPFGRNPEKLEARALEYERRGNMKKAIKNREKAAKIRAKHGTTGMGAHTTPIGLGAPMGGLGAHATPVGLGAPIGHTGIPISSTTTTVTDYVARGPADYETRATKWEQRGNYQKAQKNREKIWRLQNPQHVNTAAPSFYNNNQFVGYNVPLTGNTYTTTSTSSSAYPVTSGTSSSAYPVTSGTSSFQRTSFWGQNTRDPLIYENRAAEYQRLGNQKKYLRYQQKAGMLRSNNGVYSSRRTVADYERNALKWEQRGNWQKAQKNREKAWRLQNPQYMMNTWTAPQFYQQQRFVGYNVPNFTSTQTNIVNSNFMNFNKATVIQGAPIVHTHTNAPIVETHVHNTIVEQTTRMEKVTEVQPIIHREIDAPQVRIVEKHMYETVPHTGPSVITNTAIVEETVKPRIIEEIQPVVHREVAQTFVEHVEQHVTEHVVLPTTETRSVIDTRAMSNLSIGQSFYTIAYPGYSSFHQYSQFGRPTRDVTLYQRRLAEYERLGNQKKAQRYREKIARLGAGGGQYKSTRTPTDYERKAMKWEQRGNWQKAQRNREKAWRLQNPQYLSFNQHPAPQFYNNNQFLGYNQTIPTLPLGQGQGLTQGFAPTQGLAQGGVYQRSPYSQFGLTTRNPSLYEQKAQEYERRGKMEKANKLRRKAELIRNNKNSYTSQRTPASYERNAAKWEQKGNFQKAQKNREKAWRLNNPSYMNLNHQAPSFYNNGKFLGYNQQAPGTRF